MVLLVIAALGPAKSQPRTRLGFEIVHFLGYSQSRSTAQAGRWRQLCLLSSSSEHAGP
jgi:hypothetical protein